MNQLLLNIKGVSCAAINAGIKHAQNSSANSKIEDAEKLRYKNSYIRNIGNIGNAAKVDKTVSYLVKNIRINISYFLFVVTLI
jgi:hypothetical protein